jgi:hypothetical protein
MDTPEPIVNLWYVVDRETMMAYSLLGRVYMVAGTEQEKLRLLEKLAPSDYFLAKQFPVPKRIQTVANDRAFQGITPASSVKFQVSELYREVLDELEKDLPKRVRFDHDNPIIEKAKIPTEFLYVVTALIEQENGQLLPYV